MKCVALHHGKYQATIGIGQGAWHAVQMVSSRWCLVGAADMLMEKAAHNNPHAQPTVPEESALLSNCFSPRPRTPFPPIALCMCARKPDRNSAS